jgi:hypothetical protein
MALKRISAATILFVEPAFAGALVFCGRDVPNSVFMFSSLDGRAIRGAPDDRLNTSAHEQRDCEQYEYGVCSTKASTHLLDLLGKLDQVNSP